MLTVFDTSKNIKNYVVLQGIHRQREYLQTQWM